jgi:hypothetical protein
MNYGRTMMVYVHCFLFRGVAYEEVELQVLFLEVFVVLQQGPQCGSSRLFYSLFFFLAACIRTAITLSCCLQKPGVIDIFTILIFLSNYK